MGATAAIAMFAGSLLDAGGQLAAGEAQAERFAQNAAFADLQAEDALARGREAERRHRLGIRQLIGEQRAALAAQGLDLAQGSALAIQEDTAAIGELDALTIRNNAAREAFGFRVQAQDFRTRSRLARRAGTVDAFSTLLGSGGSLAYRLFGDRGGSAPPFGLYGDTFPGTGPGFGIGPA